MSLTVTDLGLPTRIASGIDVAGGLPVNPARPVQGECWLWTRGTYPSGYGRTWLNGESRGLHQVTYEAATGVRSDRRMFVDHVCRNRLCCNPAHLDLVTPEGNQLTAQREQCSSGHDFTPANTYRMPNSPNQRSCRACARAKSARYRARRAA